MVLVAVLLCGDIGGTSTRLALFDPGRPLEPVALATSASGAVQDFDALCATFLAGGAQIEAACFGIAGPVLGRRVRPTNLPWVVDADALSARLSGAPVFLLNDLEALAYGITVLPADRSAVLNPGRAAPAGNIAVIAAGTGLGEAGLVWDGRRYVSVASEGGHTDFAPRSAREIELLRHLLSRYPHVSYERLVSGPGLVHVLEYLRDVEGSAVPPPLAARLDGPGAAAAITEAALAGTAPIAAAALDLFVAMYGAEAGNFALKLKATGGVWVGGGIAPKILPKLQDGTFRAAFLAKGRFAAFLAEIPVRVVLDERTVLYGAARYARDRTVSPSATRADGD